MNNFSCECKNEIERLGRITSKMQETLFLGMSVKEIRNCLKENGMDFHMPIELRSTEIAIVTPCGVMMQIRSYDRNQLGLWGGVIEENETPEEGAVRELYEELELYVTKDQLTFVEEDDHFHQYANGDKAIFHAYRFVIYFDFIPTIKTNEESAGVAYVDHTILSHQRDYVQRILDGFESLDGFRKTS